MFCVYLCEKIMFSPRFAANAQQTLLKFTPGNLDLWRDRNCAVATDWMSGGEATSKYRECDWNLRVKNEFIFSASIFVYSVCLWMQTFIQTAGVKLLLFERKILTALFGATRMENVPKTLRKNEIYRKHWQANIISIFKTFGTRNLGHK